MLAAIANCSYWALNQTVGTTLGNTVLDQSIGATIRVEQGVGETALTPLGPGPVHQSMRIEGVEEVRALLQVEVEAHLSTVIANSSIRKIVTAGFLQQ